MRIQSLNCHTLDGQLDELEASVRALRRRINSLQSHADALVISTLEHDMDDLDQQWARLNRHWPQVIAELIDNGTGSPEV